MRTRGGDGKAQDEDIGQYNCRAVDQGGVAGLKAEWEG